MATDHDPVPQYPTVRLIVRHGEKIALGLSALPFVLVLLAGIPSPPWWTVVAGVAAMPVLYLLLRSYVELVRIISDTLLPR